MRRTLSEGPLSALLLLAALLVLPAQAQAQEAQSRVVSSEIALSRDAAELSLELEDGRQLALQLAEDGSVRLNNARIGTYDGVATWTDRGESCSSEPWTRPRASSRAFLRPGMPRRPRARSESG
jgi:hypothetical protein